MNRKILFIDRDGTLIKEPEDFQIDSLEKLELVDNVIPALLELKKNDFEFVMISNQDGLGTDSFPEDTFWPAHKKMLSIFSSQKITFADILICPHFDHQGCECRKPRTGLVQKYLADRSFDPKHSYVIGDRDTDLSLAAKMGITGIKLTADFGWDDVVKQILVKAKARVAEVIRKTTETEIRVQVNLDDAQKCECNTGIGFFDHMLSQISRHGGIGLEVFAKGDIHVDFHHTIEDVALCLGQALREALGDKKGIRRYGFVVPMDESLARVDMALDLGGRSYVNFDAVFLGDKIGEYPTSMTEHFFRSVAETLRANIHLKVRGRDDHHMIEALFKAFAKSLKDAVRIENDELPSTKGVL